MTKHPPLTISLTDWPRVTIRGENVTLPLPREGNRGHHVCAPAVPSECRACRCRREREDVREVKRMFAGGAVAPNQNRILEAWET